MIQFYCKGPDQYESPRGRVKKIQCCYSEIVSDYFKFTGGKTTGTFVICRRSADKRNTIKNISQKGVFIETKRPLFVGEELILSFSIPGAGKPFKVKGEIVQVSRSGIGVEFKSMSPYIEEMIATMINRMKTDLE